MIKLRIPSANEALYLRSDHHKKVKNFKKTKTATKSTKIIVQNMLIVSKYDHLCENLTFNGHLCEICSMCENMTFIGYLCEICSMCENMAIDVLVLFLKCVQFLKSCVQFLVDTILNLTIV
jgi:hypothetical protein